MLLLCWVCFEQRTRKRPKALPLGSLKLTRPTLESAHILTGVQAVHARLGLTGKGIKVGIIGKEKWRGEGVVMNRKIDTL
jgi:hypothetical protein